MRYLLVVGFFCDVYRREPRARIFVANQLLDDFYIPHTPDNLSVAENIFLRHRHPLQPLNRLEFQKCSIKNFPTLRFYEVELDEKIKHMTLSIDIANSDSNYTNGFITHSTLINLKICFFFPLDKRILIRLQNIRNKNRSKNIAWYIMPKNQTFDLGVNGICWKAADVRKNDNTKLNYYRDYYIGGDGAFVCELYKKYGIFMPTLARACRHNFNYLLINYFFDKYFHHAHLRNSN